MVLLVSKKTSRREFLIQKKLHDLVPKYVPKPISYKNGIMKTRKYGVSLKKWLLTHKYTDVTLSQIIKNVRLILGKIRRKYPEFRHMDLHLENVLFYKGRIMIIDFGLSKLSRHGNTPVCYDINTFLNSLRRFVIRRRYAKFRAMKKFTGNESAASIAKRLTMFKV